MVFNWNRFSSSAVPFAPHLDAACTQFGITTPLRLAHFAAQLAHESGDFRRLVESLNYKPEALLATFGRHRINEDEAQRYGRTAAHPADQPAIANCVYGGDWGRQHLGNTDPDDGWRYRGRGLIQLTGKDNYRRASLGLNGDASFIHDPEQITEPKPAALVAAWLWQDKGLNKWADLDDLERICRRINGGLNGLDDRRKWYERAKDCLT